jgi:hypothetical protein
MTARVPSRDLRIFCVLSRNLLMMFLTGMSALLTPQAIAQYSTRVLINSNTFPTDTTPGFGFGQPIVTDGTWAAYSTNDAVWSQPLAGGTPKKLFSVGTTMPGSSVPAAYIFPQVEISGGTVVFLANNGGNLGIYGLYSIKADGSAEARRVADSTIAPSVQDSGSPNSILWYDDMSVYGNYGVFQVSHGVVVFALSGILFSANIDGTNLKTLWQTFPKPGFQGCPTGGEYNNIFLTVAAAEPTTNGTDVAFTASSYLDFVALYNAPLPSDDNCKDLITSGVGNTGGPVSTLPGQPQDGIAFVFAGGQGIVIDGDYVYFGASAGNGVVYGESYTGYFKIPLAGGAATPVVTNLSQVPGLTNPDGSYAQVYLGGFAVNNGEFVFLAQDVAGNDPAAFYKVEGSKFVKLFASGTSVDNNCVGSLEYGNLGGLNSVSLSASGQLVFSAEQLSYGPDLNGACNDFFRFQPIGYFALDTNHPLIPTQTAISIAPAANAKYGDPLTMNIQVSAAAGASNPKSLVPTGVVTVFFTNPRIYGVQVPGTATLDADGRATVSLGTENGGVYTYSVAYGGDSEFSSNASAKLVEDLQATVTLKLTASGTKAVIGKPLTFTATLTNSDSYAMYGTVSLLDGTNVVAAQGNYSSTNTNTFTVTAAQLGCATTSLTATYSGDPTTAPGTSNAVAITGLDCATTTLAGPASAVYGAQNILAATVAGVKGGPAPTGTVAFASGAATYGTVALNSAGKATLGTLALPGGSDSVTATYSGDSNYTASASPAFTLDVTPASSSVAIAVTPAKPALGETVTLAATATGLAGGAAPAGTVTFLDGAGTLGTATLDATGKGTLQTAGLTFGANSVIAQYGGDPQYSKSASAVLAVSVGQAETATSISDASLSVVRNTDITFNAKVAVPGSSIIPTGTVSFLDYSKVLGSASLDATGAASFSTATLPTGVHKITAAYQGAAGFATSSGSLEETITAVPPAAPR